MINNDDVTQKTIVLLNKGLCKLEKIHSLKFTYKILFKYIRFSLKKDLEKTNAEYKIGINDANKKIPNKFWIMWWQGLDKAPSLIRQNVKRLQYFFGEQNVFIITKENYQEYTNISKTIIDKFNNNNISFTSLSDIIRFNVLKNYGGFWIDSTVALSNKFVEYFKKETKGPFFSICNVNGNYHNISVSKWTIWFIGGVPNYDLFNYLDKFYEIYYTNHNKSIDYFLTDDVISYYYLKNLAFQNYCKKLSRTWYPYYFVSKFDKKFKQIYLSMFNNNIDYSVQKLTYKYSEDILRDKNSTLYHLYGKQWSLDDK